MASTSTPEPALANVGGKTLSAVSSASCVAANSGEVDLAIKATSAALPNPTPTYSADITAAKAQLLTPISESSANT